MSMIELGDLYGDAMRKSIAADGFDIETCVDQREFVQMHQLLARDPSIKRTIEIGCALGFSSVAILSAIAGREGASHTILDPFQDEQWKGRGRELVERFGLSAQVRFVAERSEYALPDLVRAGESFDFVLIDGWHTFDHTMVDFFYALRLVRVGGLIGVDDAGWDAVGKVLSYVLQYPAVQLVSQVNRSRLGKMVDYLPGGLRGLLPNQIKERLDCRSYGSMVFLRKVQDDQRRWDWYRRF